jgi:hypothetical protein
MLTKKIIGTSVIATALLVGVGFTATSAEAKKSIKESFTQKMYSGIVQDFTLNKLTLKTFDGRTIHLNIDDQTKFNDPITEGDDLDATVGDGDNARSVKRHDGARYGHDNHDNDHNNRDHDKGRHDGDDRGYNDGHGNQGDHRDDGHYGNGHSNDWKDAYKQGYEEGYARGQADYQKEHGGNH